MADRCGSCGAWLMPGAEHCETCHARVGSVGHAAPGRVDLDDPLRGGGDLGDLELDLPVAPPARAAAPMAGGHAGDDPLDPLGAGAGGGPSLELDVPAPARPRAAAPPVGVAEVGPASMRLRPGGSARGAAVYDAEVESLAGYGRPPDGLFGAIPYTLHVLTRRRELRAQLGAAVRAREAADAGARRALVDVGRELLARAGTLDLGEVTPFLAAAQTLAGDVEEHGRARGEASAELAERRRTLEAQIREAEADANPWRDRETKLVTQLGVRQGDLERAQARLRRIEIELRNLAQAQQAGQAVDPDRLASLEADREARRAEVTAAEGPVQKLVRDLGEVRRELAPRVERVTQLEAERRAAEEAMRQVESMHAAAASEVSRAFDDALLRLGEEAHVRQLDAPLGPPAARAEAALAHLEDRRRSEELHRRALEAYHGPAFKKGAAILGGAAFVILVMLVFVVVK